MLEQVAEAIDRDLVRNDQHALAAEVALERIHHAAQAQDHVAPAFAARWPEVEFADVAALLVQVGEVVGDAVRGQAVEHAEFLFAQALVGAHAQQAVTVEVTHHKVGRLGGAHVRRVQHHGRALILGQGREPGAEGIGLALAQFGQGHVDIAFGNVDMVSRGRFSQIARDIACALAVPDDPDFLWPFLFHRVRQRVNLASS